MVPGPFLGLTWDLCLIVSLQGFWVQGSPSTCMAIGVTSSMLISRPWHSWMGLARPTKVPNLTLLDPHVIPFPSLQSH